MIRSKKKLSGRRPSPRVLRVISRPFGLGRWICFSNNFFVWWYKISNDNSLYSARNSLSNETGWKEIGWKKNVTGRASFGRRGSVRQAPGTEKRGKTGAKTRWFLIFHGSAIDRTIRGWWQLESQENSASNGQGFEPPRKGRSHGGFCRPRQYLGRGRDQRDRGKEKRPRSVLFFSS